MRHKRYSIPKIYNHGASMAFVIYLSTLIKRNKVYLVFTRDGYHIVRELTNISYVHHHSTNNNYYNEPVTTYSFHIRNSGAIHMPSTYINEYNHRFFILYR